MFSRLLYYLVLAPLSRMPFWLLHVLSSVLYFFLYYIIGYRKKVVRENLRRSFPEKSEQERHRIEKDFFLHLADIFLEGVKAFHITKDQLRKHVSCRNPEVVRRFYDEGKDVIIAVGHYGSWELLLTGLNLFIRHRAVVIYKPLSNAYLDKKLRESRGEYRTMLLPMQQVKPFFTEPRKELSAVVFAIDQSPSNPQSAWWTNFLHQETGVLFGTEKYAKTYDIPVVYAHIHREKRGHYSLTFETVAAAPRETPEGMITENATKLLEQDIIAAPAWWLWSHKRWKHKRPGKV